MPKFKNLHIKIKAIDNVSKPLKRLIPMTLTQKILALATTGILCLLFLIANKPYYAIATLVASAFIFDVIELNSYLQNKDKPQ